MQPQICVLAVYIFYQCMSVSAEQCIYRALAIAQVGMISQRQLLNMFVQFVSVDDAHTCVWMIVAKNFATDLLDNLLVL